MANQRTVDICDKLILGALVLLVFFISLAQTASTYAVNEPIKLMLLRITTIVIMALWLVRIVESRELSLLRTPLDLPILSFLFLATVATLVSIDSRLSLWGQLYRYEGLVTILNYAFIYYATVNFVRGERERSLVLGAVLVVSGVVGAYAVLQRFGIDYISWDPGMMDVSRSIATFGNSVFLGAFLTLVLPIAVVYALFFPTRMSKREAMGDRERAANDQALDSSRFEFSGENQPQGTSHEEPRAGYQAPAIIPLLLRISSILLVPLLIAALVFSYTRAAWLGFLGALVFFGLFFFREVRGQKKMIALVAAVIIVAVATVGLLVSSLDVAAKRSLAERVRSVTRLSGGSVVSRLALWDTSLRAIKDRPLLGFGLDTYALVFQRYQPANWYRTIEEKAMPDKTHNEMLQVAVSAGLLGLLAYLWILVTFVLKGLVFLLKKVRFPHRSVNRILMLGLMGAVIGYLIQIQLSFSIISVAPIFWFVLGLAVPVIGKEPASSVSFRFPESSSSRSSRAILHAGLVIVVVLLSVSAVRPFLADQHARKAWGNLSFNFFDEAARELETAVKLDPGEPRYSIRLAETYLMKYRAKPDTLTRQRAFTALETARALSPENENVYFYLGGLYVEMGKTNPVYYDQAIGSYRKVLALSPNDVNAHYDLGIVYANRRKMNLAIKEWKRAVALDPRFVAAYVVLGRAYELRKELGQAKEMYQRVLEIDGNNSFAKRALENLNKQ